MNEATYMLTIAAVFIIGLMLLLGGCSTADMILRDSDRCKASIEFECDCRNGSLLNLE